MSIADRFARWAASPTNLNDKPAPPTAQEETDALYAARWEAQQAERAAWEAERAAAQSRQARAGTTKAPQNTTSDEAPIDWSLLL